jgi:hypothetical protein
MAEGILLALYLALLGSLVVAFFWMAFNIAAIRGHCGRELTLADAP